MEQISVRILILLIVVALIVIIGSVFDPGYAEGIFYEAALVAAAFCLLWLLAIFYFEKKELVIERRSRVLFFLALFILGGFVSCLFSVVKHRSWSEFLVWLAGLAIFFVLSQIANSAVIKRAAWFFTILALAVAILGLFMYLDIEKPLFTRAYAPLLNPNTLAGYLVGLWPIALSLLFLKTERKIKLFLYLANVAIGILFALTISYTGWLSLILVLAFGSYLFRKEIFNRRFLMIVLAVVLIILAGAAVFRYFFGLPFKESITLRLPQVGAVTSYTHRFLYLQAGWQIFYQNFFTGVGLRNFSVPYLKQLKSIKEVPVSTHNNFLDLAVGLGIFGLVGFVGFILFLFWKGLKVLKESQNPYLAGFFLGWLGMVINSGLDFSWEIKVTVINFWIFSGLLYGWWLAQNPAETRVIKMAKPALLFIVFLAGVFFLRGGQIFLGKNYQMRAERYQAVGDIEAAANFYQKSWWFNKDATVLIEMAELHYFSAQKDNNPATWRLAEQAVQAAIKEVPAHYYSYQLLARIYEAQKRFPEAAAQYEKALALNPKFDIALKAESLRNYLTLKEYQKVISEVENFLALFEQQDWPSYYAAMMAANWEKPARESQVYKIVAELLFYQGQAYLALGDADKAKESWQKALEKVASFEQVQKALSELGARK